MKKYTITHMFRTGHGVTIDNEKQILILGTFPGDVVRASIYKNLDQIAFAEIEEFIKYSEHHTHKPTQKPFFDANSPWEYLSRKSELEIKQNIIQDIFDAHLISNPVFEKIPFPEHLQENEYRNKVAYSFMHDKKNNNKLCFALYKRGTNNHSVQKIPQEKNKLVHPLLEKVGKQFLHFLNQKNITEDNLKYLILRYSYSENNVVAHILVPENNRKKIAFKKNDLEAFLNNQSFIKGILVSYSEKNIRSAQTMKDFHTLGDVDIHEQVLGKIYTYHPSLFFQIYPEAFAEILKDTRDYIQNIPDNKTYELLDLFAGVGIIGIELADLVDKVTGVELSSLSKKYALHNANINKIENYHFFESSVDEILDRIQPHQILIVDPTRAGLSKETINIIAEKQPAYIIYISCNPVTQSQNIAELEHLYTIEKMKAYNLFPKTHHIESLVILKRNA